MDVRSGAKRNWLSAATTHLRKMSTLTFSFCSYLLVPHRDSLPDTMTPTPHPEFGVKFASPSPTTPIYAGHLWLMIVVSILAQGTGSQALSKPRGPSRTSNAMVRLRARVKGRGKGSCGITGPGMGLWVGTWFPDCLNENPVSQTTARGQHRPSCSQR